MDCKISVEVPEDDQPVSPVPVRKKLDSYIVPVVFDKSDVHYKGTGDRGEGT